MGHFLNRKISQAPDHLQKSFAPQNVRFEERINSQVPDTSSDIAIGVESIREFCAFINLSGICPNFSISLPIGRSNSHLSSDWSSFCQTKCLRKKNKKSGLLLGLFINEGKIWCFVKLEKSSKPIQDKTLNF